jgi:hypothetical protein
MAAAVERGIPATVIAAAFDLRSVRTVREACHWAARERNRNRAFGTILHELGRVLPRE